jgi:hypothetical protein
MVELHGSKDGPMTISPDELEALTTYITELEAQVAEQAERLDMLERHYVLHTEGPEALRSRHAAPDPHVGAVPDGWSIGNAGQLIRVRLPR